MRETTTIPNPGGWRHVWLCWFSPEGDEYREASKRETPDLIIIPTIEGLIPLRLRRYHGRRTCEESRSLAT